MKPGSKQSDQDQRQQTTQRDTNGSDGLNSDGDKYRDDTRRVESPRPAEDERGGNTPQGRAGKAIVHPDDELVDDPQEETAKRSNR